MPGRDFRRVPHIRVPAGRTEFTLRIPIINNDVPNPADRGQIVIQASPDQVPQGQSPAPVYHTVYVYDDGDGEITVTTTPTLYEGQTKTITIENVPSGYGRTIQEERNFYFITENTAYPFTTTTRRNPDQKCSTYGDYNPRGVDICIKDHSWDPDNRVARIRLTALRDREAEGEEHVYMRFGKHLNYGTHTHVFKITVTDYPTEYDQPTNPVPGRRFWCKESAPSIYDLYPDFTGGSLEGEQRATFLEALSNLRYISPPPPVLVAEWDKSGYDVGETATIKFSAQDQAGNPRRVCGSVTINYFVNSQPSSAGGTLPIPKGPRGHHPDWSYLKTISINPGGTEAQASYTIRADGTLSFHVLEAYTNDRNDHAVQLHVPTLKDGDGNILTPGGESPPATAVTSASVEMAPAPDPEVSIGGAGGGEEGTPVGFQLVADPAPPAGESVDVGVTITAVGDFGVQTGTRTVTIGSGGTAFVDLPTTDDENDEPDGEVTLTINPGDGYTLGVPATMTIPISDNDDPDDDGGNSGNPISDSEPQVDPAPDAIPEVTITGGSGITEGGTATFTISASPVPASPITVNVGVSQDGSWGATGATTVSVSGASATYTITTSDDQTDESDGSVTATVQSGQGYTVGSASSASVEVSDDDDPPPATPEVTITGGSGITEGGTATFTISASPAPSSPITVNVGVSQDGSWGATGATTVSVSGASATYTITTSDDQTDEPDGSVTAAVQSGDGYTVGSASSATVTVADDDDPPPATPEITISGGSGITEGGTASFTISASPAPSSPITVNVGVSQDGSWGATGVATVSVSGASATYTITTSDDQTDEPDGSVTAAVQSGDGYTVGSASSASVTVSDDDPPPATPEITISGGSGITEGGTASFTISASPAPSSPITVNIGVSQDGSWGATGATTVSVSGASATYTITTSDDQTDEPDGSVTAAVQSGDGYTVGSASSATVTVADDDDPPPGNSGTLTVSIANPEHRARRAEFLEFTVSASQTAQQDVTVSYTLSTISLAPDLDYCLIGAEEPDDDFLCLHLPRSHDNRRGEVTIAAGEDRATIFVWIDRDAWVKPGSQILVFLKDVEGAKEITEDYASGRVNE